MFYFGKKSNISLFFFLDRFQLGPNVSIGTGVTIGAGVRVRESVILHGATLQVSGSKNPIIFCTGILINRHNVVIIQGTRS